MTLTHHSDCAARVAPCGCGLDDRLKTMIALLSIDVGKACGVLSNHGLAPELVDAAMANVHRVETRAGGGGADGERRARVARHLPRGVAGPVEDAADREGPAAPGRRRGVGGGMP